MRYSGFAQLPIACAVSLAISYAYIHIIAPLLPATGFLVLFPPIALFLAALWLKVTERLAYDWSLVSERTKDVLALFLFDFIVITVWSPLTGIWSYLNFIAYLRFTVSHPVLLVGLGPFGISITWLLGLIVLLGIPALANVMWMRTGLITGASPSGVIQERISKAAS